MAQELLRNGGVIGLPWVTLRAFIRISTSSRNRANPKPAEEAFAIVGDWLRQSGASHCILVQRPLVADVVLAAVAMEYRALLASTDQDFRCFPELRLLNPLGG